MCLENMIAILALTWSLSASAADSSWYVEYDEAEAEAARSCKDLLIDFGGSDWCLPCRLLKSNILSRPEFVERAGNDFVLVDIDNLMRKPMPEDRKQRYEKLQQRFGIDAFPTVVLATPEGRAYAQTTYLESIQDPAAYWDHLQPLYQRGQQSRTAFDRAENLVGEPRADALAEGLSWVHPEFVTRFYSDQVNELARLTPEDETGYLAFLEGRKAVEELQEQVKESSLTEVSAEAVDAAIETHKLQGESLQEALLLRALCHLQADQPWKALESLSAMLAAQQTRSRYDRGDFIPLNQESISVVRQRIEAGRKDAQDRLAQYYALHRIFEFELPDRFEISCGHGYRPAFLARGLVGEQYGQALLKATADLPARERATALGEGLERTLFWRQDAIKKIVDEVIPQLVGADKAANYLPHPYRSWVAR